jgi:glycosyltransferase involved in cell wall biosynthesis
MKIAIVGTRGIPNYYGGFEQFASFLSVGLADKGHEVVVYNSHDHPYQGKSWNNVEIVHCYNPEKQLGSAAQFIYDLNCIMDARKRKFDVLLLLGYTSISIWGRLYPKDSVVIINMDGLEWKRAKFSKPVQKFLKWAEKLAIHFCDYYIADSLKIQAYLNEKYQVRSKYIPYGAEVFSTEEEQELLQYNIDKYQYCLFLARIVPENNIEIVLDGFQASKSSKKMVVIGSVDSSFGKYIKKKFSDNSRIQFIGPLYDAEKIHVLKAFSFLYFHGNSVGGTNPSLLEAMASRALIAAHENPFNRSVLDDNAFYFSSSAEVTRLIETTNRNGREIQRIQNNLDRIKNDFTWENIIDQYERFMLECVREPGFTGSARPPIPRVLKNKPQGQRMDI